MKETKELLKEKAKNKYRELSEEKKNKKREYGRNRYHNMQEIDIIICLKKQQQELKEYPKKYCVSKKST